VRASLAPGAESFYFLADYHALIKVGRARGGDAGQDAQWTHENSDFKNCKNRTVKILVFTVGYRSKKARGDNRACSAS